MRNSEVLPYANRCQPFKGSNLEGCYVGYAYAIFSYGEPIYAYARGQWFAATHLLPRSQRHAVQTRPPGLPHNCTLTEMQGLLEQALRPK